MDVVQSTTLHPGGCNESIMCNQGFKDDGVLKVTSFRVMCGYNMSVRSVVGGLLLTVKHGRKARVFVSVEQCRRARRVTLASQPHMGAETLWISNMPHPTWGRSWFKDLVLIRAVAFGCDAKSMSQHVV